MPHARIRKIMLSLSVTFVLAACAVQPPASQPPGTELAQPLVRTSTPLGSSPTATAGQAAVTPTAPEAAATAPTAAATEAPPEAQQLYDGIPFSQNPEGFYELGQPEAPVTLIDYSDFL